MELIPEWAPNIHPMLVHFPIALLISAVVTNLISFFVPEKWWDETKNSILYIAGALSAIAVYYSGKAAADSIFLPTEAQGILSEHADFAFWTIWFFVLYAALRIAFHWFKLMDKQSFKIVAFITVLPGLFLLFETAEHGGEMVFGYGAGTGQLLQQESIEAMSPGELTAPSDFTPKASGGWTWTITNTAVSDLLGNFNWIEGSVNELNPTVARNDETSLLKLEAPSESNFFVTNDTFKNVQIDYYLSLSGFQGEVMLVHHVQDQKNYDFVSLNSEGEIAQGRMSNGERTIFEEGSFNPDGSLFIRVVGDGTHFRGYVNKEMVVHGHGDAPDAGAVGIKLDGAGTLFLSKIELTNLN
ncbi:MAG: hypothetical protein FH748_11035 [Balneolaceae bacterium]|nr:hypothetical protein [Balneolaceae bacterium]